MNRLTACVLLVVLSIFIPVTAYSEVAARSFEPRDLFSLEVASDPQISPDGNRVAYVRRSGDIMTDRMRPTIWVVDVRTGEQMPVVAGPGSHSQPRWSPDGNRLAYISTAEGGSAQLFVRWMQSGESVRLSRLPQTPTSISWSPDGRRIGYSMFVPGEGMKLGRSPEKPEGAAWAEPLEIHTALTYRTDSRGYLKPGNSHIFLIPADGGATRQLTYGPFNDEGPLSWTPDGSTILFSGSRSPSWEVEPFDSEVFALELDGNRLTSLTDRDGPDSHPVASPDGRLIAYLGFDDKKLGYHNTMLYVMNRDGSNQRALTASLDRSVESPVWSSDSRSIYVAYDDRGETRIARIGLDGRLTGVVDGLSGSSLDRPYTGGSFSVARNGVLAITSGSATRPSDIAVVEAGRKRQLTRLNTELLNEQRLGSVRKIDVTSFDDRTIDAWITLPPDHKDGQRHPLILEIHGGPFAAYGPHFSTDNQLYASAGYVVLSVNPRGSSSYGTEFANQIHHAYPGRDYDDLMSAVDAAIAQGYADGDRLFVTGGSGGGVLTAWIVGKTDRFKAAATQKPVIDWSSFVLTADIPAFFSRYWFGEYPWENPEAFWARSPLSLVGNVKTPTLVVVGSEDYRTPVSESEQYYTALRLLGVPTALVKVPGASHGGLAARPSQSGAKASAILAWFERYSDGMPASRRD
ncbi:MAG TPA: S9 family peptidase [Thermoanaerobaculia bacterium]|nr:S9 family peptidase [Thermoanaerobaculia bacterium]